MGDPKNVGLTAHWFKEELAKQRHLSGQVDRLAFVEKQEGPVGALTLKDLLSWQTNIPSAIVRPGRKGPALRIKLLHKQAPSRQGGDYGVTSERFRSNGNPERVILVSDVATTGITILNSVKLIERAGGKVDAAFVLYDREELSQSNDRSLTAEEKLKENGVRLVAMIKAKQIKTAMESVKSIGDAAKTKGVR